MNVAKYTFQSPYPSPVQVGRLDPNLSRESSSLSANSNFTTSPIQSKAQSFQSSQEKEVIPSVSADRLLDTYA